MAPVRSLAQRDGSTALNEIRSALAHAGRRPKGLPATRAQIDTQPQEALST